MERLRLAEFRLRKASHTFRSRPPPTLQPETTRSPGWRNASRELVGISSCKLSVSPPRHVGRSHRQPFNHAPMPVPSISGPSPSHQLTTPRPSLCTARPRVQSATYVADVGFRRVCRLPFPVLTTSEIGLILAMSHLSPSRTTRTCDPVFRQ